MLAALYAVSSGMIAQSRVFWNPTTVPLFSSMILLSMIYISQQKKYSWQWFAILGACLGILVQLHASTYIYLPVTCIWGLLLVFQTKQKKRLIPYAGYTLIAFISILAPYIWYEITHGFEDILGVAENAPSSNMSKRQLMYTLPSRALELLARSTAPVLPYSSAGIALVLGIGISIGACIKRLYWVLALIVFFAGSIGLLSIQQSTPDHYLSFLAIIPFVLIGAVLAQFTPRIRLVLGAMLILVLLYQTTQTQYNNPKYEIKRTHEITQTILNNTRNAPFAYAQISSPSFSDLHTRYLLRHEGVIPEDIETGSYTQLFLVCESVSCPSFEEMQARTSVEVMCFEKYCDRPKPQFSLSSWDLIHTTNITHGAVYHYVQQM
jgi:hypothetical protein